MQPVEFRLYYDSVGNVIYYTCEKPEGQYIVVDTATYAAGRLDVKVIDGQLLPSSESIFAQLVQTINGVVCAKQDVSIIVTDDYQDTNTWDVKLHRVVGA